MAHSIIALSDKGERKPRVENGPILSFHASCLYQEDAECVAPGGWINDNIVVFWMEYMAHVEYPTRADLCFVHPGAVFMALFEDDDDELMLALKGLHLSDRQMVFFPVNNNPDPSLPLGGTHWSLLVWDRRGKQFHHYDSAPLLGNAEVADRVATKMWPVISAHLSYFLEVPPRPPVNTGRIPTQANDSDCGVHMLMTMTSLVLAGVPLPQLDDVVTPSAVAEYRDFIRTTLGRLSEEWSQVMRKSSTVAKPIQVHALKPEARDGFRYGPEGPPPSERPPTAPKPPLPPPAEAAGGAAAGGGGGKGSSRSGSPSKAGSRGSSPSRPARAATPGKPPGSPGRSTPASPKRPGPR